MSKLDRIPYKKLADVCIAVGEKVRAAVGAGTEDELTDSVEDGKQAIDKAYYLTGEVDGAGERRLAVPASRTAAESD